MAADAERMGIQRASRAAFGHSLFDGQDLLVGEETFRICTHHRYGCNACQQAVCFAALEPRLES